MIDKNKEAILNAKIKQLNGYDKECNITITEYVPSYNLYKNLPKIVFIIIASLGVLFGIIYGIILDSFGAFILPVIATLILGLITMFLLKIQCSERILNLEYTRKLYYAVKIKTYEDELSKLNQENEEN